jgi:aldose 1-epimerase
VELIAGYPYAQVFAPADKDYVALEPMTAPTNALRSGRGLRRVEPGETFRATFRMRIEETSRRRDAVPSRGQQRLRRTT